MHTYVRIDDEAKDLDWHVSRRGQQARDAPPRSARCGVNPWDGARQGERPKDFAQARVAARPGFSQRWLAKMERGSRFLTVFDASHCRRIRDSAYECTLARSWTLKELSGLCSALKPGR